MLLKMTAALVAAIVVMSAPAWGQGGGGAGGGGSGGSGGSSSGGAAGSAPGNAGPTGASGSPGKGNVNSGTRENGVNDNKAVPSPSTTNNSSSAPSYGQSPAGAAATKSMSSTNAGVMATPNASPPSSDNGNASVAPDGRAGDKTPSRDVR